MDDGVHPTVTSQLAISLSDKSGTRMTDAIVQEGANTNLSKFRGIRDLKLIPYATAGTIAVANPALGTAIELPLDGALPSMENANTIESLNSASNSQVYQDVDIPSGTCSFLVYGEAPPSTNLGGLPTGFVNGSLTASGWPTDANLAAKPSFALEQICSTNTANATATLLASYLTEVAEAFYVSHLVGDPSVPSEAETLYNNLLTNKAGASADVTAMLQHLYTSALDIKSRHTSVSNAYKAADQVINAILGTNNSYATDVGEGNLAFSSSLLGYPENLHLPAGAARIYWDSSSNQFNVVTTNQSWLNNPDLTSYIYPPSLWYYANTRVKTSGSPHEDEMTDGTTTWTGVLSEYDTGYGTVESGVASVALNDQLQYGVARFDVTLQSTASSLKDNVNNDIPVVGNNFPITGILVCNQYNPDWQFLPVTTGTPPPAEYTVYDHAINNVDADGNAATMQLTADQSIVNHTLLIETEKDIKVKFAIELLNNYDDFYGIDDPSNADPQPMLIPKGCKFYLIGELDPAVVPSSEYAKTNGKAFKQDFTTIGEFTVSSLANACYVVPDLRISRLQLSLSANLRWQKGIVVSENWIIAP